MPDYKETLFKKYHSEYTKHLYGTMTIQDIKKSFVAMKYFYNRFLPKDKDSIMLDMGCGPGGFVYWLQEMGYRNSYGIDISAEQVELATKFGIKNITHSEITEYLKDKNNSFDAIFSRDVMHYFPKEKMLDVLGLIFTSLKPNGMFVMQVPNGESPLSGRFRYRDFAVETSYTKTSLAQVLRLSGFKDVFVIPAGGPVPHSIKSMIRLVLWKCIEAMLKIYLLAEVGTSDGIFTNNIIGTGYKKQL